MPAAKPTRNDGKELENRVHGLLELKGVQNLCREKQTPSKKIDLYFEANQFGARRRYGVECKDYQGTLTQSDLSTIYATYAGAFEAKDITDLLVVSNARLAPSAQSYVDSIPRLSHMSCDDLRNSPIDLRGYLSGLKARFSTDEIWSYHVEPQGWMRDTDSKTIIQTPTDEYKDLLGLIRSQLARARLPMVTLGAYGIGKTTLAKQLFLTLLADWESNPASPIPIYISLDRMMREQTIEGLLGTIFTSVAPSDGYNFDLFCSLNELGHFVLIFDGIDEMRHKLTWEEFEYNFDQLALLTATNPRAIVLGRPTAFMDQREYNAVIHGEPYQTSALKLPSKTSYLEVFIDPLTAPQIATFVNRFCKWRYPNRPRLEPRIRGLLDRKEVTRIHDIAKRPVQLMMLLEIFPQLPEKLDKITETSTTLADLSLDRIPESGFQ